MQVDPLRGHPPQQVMVDLVQQMVDYVESDCQLLFFGDTVFQWHNYLGYQLRQMEQFHSDFVS